jgi:hypothetical protein
MIRKTSIFLALPAVFGLLAASPAYADWHHGWGWHGGWHHGWHSGWGHPGVGVAVGAVPRYVAPPVVVAPPVAVYAPPAVAVVP